MGKRTPESTSLCRWYFNYILMIILFYFYLSNILNAGSFIVTECSYTLVLLLKYKIWTSPISGNKSWVVTKKNPALKVIFILQILHSALLSPISLKCSQMLLLSVFANFLTFSDALAFKSVSPSLCVAGLYHYTCCLWSVCPPPFFHIMVWS